MLSDPPTPAGWTRFRATPTRTCSARTAASGSVATSANMTTSARPSPGRSSMIPLDLGLRVPESLWRFWELRGHYTEARGWLERALATGSEAPPKLRALALDGLGSHRLAAGRPGDRDAGPRGESRHLAIDRRAPLDRVARSPIWVRSWSCAATWTAPRRCKRSRWPSPGKSVIPFASRSALNNLALVIWNKGDTDRATALLEESAAIKRKQGNWVGTGNHAQ